jgi:ADP-heptose:LPS heptosyltransferase
MYWQGFLRKTIKKHKEIEPESVVYISHRPEHKLLYNNIPATLVPYNGPVGYNTFCEKELGFVYNNLHEQYIADGQAVFPWTRPYFQPTKEEQEFISYAERDEKKVLDRIIIHARWTNKNNSIFKCWSRDKWAKLCDYFSKDYEVCSVGTTEAALHVPGTTDVRDLNLESLALLMVTSRLVIGPSSGPIHYASLNKTPHISWGGVAKTKTRCEDTWNIFGTPVTFIQPKPGGLHDDPASWDAELEEVINATTEMLADAKNN